MAFNVGDIIVTIRAKTDDLQRGLAEVQSMAGKTKDLGSKMHTSLENAADGSKKFALGVTAAGIAVVGLGVAGVASAASFEQSRIAFETMLGSADKARSLMTDIAKFAKETPFELPEVVAASKQLLAFGFAQEEILPNMRKLGDLASGLGVPVGQLTNVFGQVKVAGRLMGQDLLQFTNAGVPLIAALAETMKKPQSEIKKLVEEGKVGFPEVETALNSLTGEGSKFGGMMEKQSHSFSGVVSNIKDGFGQFLRTMVGITNAGDIIQGGLFDKIKHGAEMIMPVIQDLPKIIGDAFNKAKPFIAAFIGLIIGGLVPAFYSWATAMWAAFAPLAPFMAAGALLAAGINYLVNKFSSWTEVISLFGKVFGKVIGFLSDLFGDLFKEIGRVGEQIGKVLAPLFQFLGRHMDVVKKIGLVLLAVVFSPMIGLVIAMVAAIKLLTVVLGFIADHFEGIKKIVVGVMVVALSPLILLIGAIILIVKNWGKIMEFMKDVMNSVGAFFVETWQMIYGVVSTVMSAMWSIIGPILEFIKNLFIIVFGTIAIVVVLALKTIWEIVSTVFNAIWTVITTVVGWIWDRLVNAFNFYKDLIVSVFTTIFNFISGIWNSIYEVISGVVQRVIDFFAPAATWLYNKGRDIVGGLVNGVRSMAGDVWNGIKAVADKIGQFFGGAAGWLWDVGRAIVVGLVNGIRSAISWVNDAAGNVADTVKNKLKNVLGIRSPSKVFMQYGVNINEGLVMGLKKSAEMVTDAMTIPSLNVNQALMAGNGQGANNTSNKTQITNINGPIHIGSKQDADYTFKRFDRNIELEEMGLATDE